MKKIIITAGLLFAINFMSAQEITPSDAVLFGTKQLNGTARFNAMGGSFGALGGDVSGIQINPAGSALSNYNTASFTGSYRWFKNDATFLGSKSSDKDGDLQATNAGGIFVFDNTSAKNALKKVTFGVVIGTDAVYDNSQYMSGVNNQSIGNYFLGHANTGFNGQAVPTDLVKIQQGETITDLYAYLNSVANGFSAQQAMLGYQSYILNENGSNGYVSNVAPGTYNQSASVITSGYNGKLTANAGFDFNDRFYLGANINYHYLDFLKNASVYERNTSNAIENGVTEILFNNNTYTYGSGFSFNIGGLVNITNELRAGLSYESPTWYRVNDEFQQNVSTNYRVNSLQSTANVYPDVVTIYEKYTIKTPASFTGSLSYVFGKSALINIDYTRKDYSKTEYKGGGFDNLNTFYNDQLKASNEIRVGGEYRIQRVSLRAGYRFVESPYKDTSIVGDINSISGGIGYSFGTARLDLGYTFTHQPMQSQLITSGLSDNAQIKTKLNNISLTYTVHF